MRRASEIAAPAYDRLRMTVPAREALIACGNTVERDGDGGGMWPTYRVTLRRPPTGIVLCLVGHGRDQGHALRMSDEPGYPGEWPAETIAWHERGAWVPCPTCGAALVWHEAGHVPGHRVCVEGHLAQLASDGRSAAAQG